MGTNQDTPVTNMILDALNEALRQGPIRGVIIPCQWIPILIKENPDWPLKPFVKSFQLNEIPFKTSLTTSSNTIYIEIIDARDKQFDQFVN